MYPRGSVDGTIKKKTDSEWVGDVNSRKSCSGVESTTTDANCHSGKRRIVFGRGRGKQCSDGYS